MRVQKFAFNAAGAVMLLLAAAFSLGRWHENNTTLHASHEYDFAPEEFSLAPEQVYFNSGGQPVHGWHFAGKPGYPTLFYLQGNAGTLTNRLGSIKGYVDLGLNVFIYEPRGFGQSGGLAVREGFIEDSVSAYRYLVDTRGVDPDSVIILGQSLGGVPAARLATSVKCKALILEGTFLSVRQMAKDFYPNVPIWILASSDFDSASLMPKLKVPLLVIYGGKDDIIAPYHSQKLYELAPEPKDILSVPAAWHTDMFKVDPKGYYGAIAKLAGIPGPQ